MSTPSDLNWKGQIQGQPLWGSTSGPQITPTRAPQAARPITGLSSGPQVMILITGAHKAFALYKAIEEGVNHMWTVSAFQQHPRTVFVCDEDATLELKVKTVKYFKGEALTVEKALGRLEWEGGREEGGGWIYLAFILGFICFALFI